MARGQWKRKKTTQYRELDDHEIDEQISIELEESHSRSQHNLTHLSYYHEPEEVHSPLGPLEVF